MARRTLDSRFGLVLVSSLVACVAQVSGCRSNDGPLHMDEEGGTSTGGTADGGTTATGGSNDTGGTGGTSTGGTADGGTTATGGSNDTGGTESGTGGGPGTGGTGSGEGGTNEGGSQAGAGGSPDAGAGPTGGSTTVSGGAGGAGAAGGSDAGAGGDTGKTRCVYYTPGGEVVDQGGAGGAGGAGSPATIDSLKSNYVGYYLTDGAGKALYTYGADFPGDCSSPPVTNCFLDCAISWPPFNGEPRVLGKNVDDSLFGSFERNDGTAAAPVLSRQTTYMGWPLYYYKNDLAAKDTKGHAVGIWQLATVIPPNIVVIRVGSTRFVADENGHTLYTYANDTKGTATSAPKSACTGSCLDGFEPFVLTYLSPVSYLPPSNFSFFVRSDGSPQIAYKGAPLYISYADSRSGQTNGTATAGWSVAAQ